MKKTNLQLLVLLLVAVLILSACGSSPAATLDGTSWKLVSYGPLTSQNLAVADATTSLIFDNQGKMSGNTGCNGFSGDYKASADKLTPGALMSTLMACSDPLMTQESVILSTLNGALNYKIDNDVLSIYSADGQTLLIFTRQQPSSAPG